MRASIRDVAEKAGVSAVTVSNVLRGRNGRASQETRERVLLAAREFNYAPVSQPMVQSRHVETRTIGLVFDHVVIEDAWGLPTYRGMIEKAREHGYDLLTLLRAPADWMLDSHELHFLDRRSDGLVFLVPTERARVLETLVQHHIPAAACFVNDVPEGVATVVLDDFGTMKRATEYLIAHGHRKIILIAEVEERSDFRARREGYESAMRQARLPPNVLQLPGLNEQGCYRWEAEFQRRLERRAFTAVVAIDDDYALHAANLVEAAGLSVPGDVSIIGMDDIPAAAPRGLTTFRVSCEEVGRYAVEAIVRMIAGDDYQACSRVLPAELVERNSVAPPKLKRAEKLEEDLK
jgi:DNA-binding LacI/PurR family transcriptional regulator